MRKTMQVRPAHILRMVTRLSKKYPELDFSNIVTIDETELQTRFDIPDLAGLYNTNTDTVYVGLPKIIACRYFAPRQMAAVAVVVLHEVIHRKQKEINPQSKDHGKLFQKLCLKYGLDPRKEIAHDKGQKLKVKIPKALKKYYYHMGTLDYPKYRDFWDEEYTSRKIWKIGRQIGHGMLKRDIREGNLQHHRDDYLGEGIRAYYEHEYRKTFNAYFFCLAIVKNYHYSNADNAYLAEMIAKETT